MLFPSAVFAPRAFSCHRQRILGSGSHDNLRKHLPPPPRSLRLLPSLRFLCGEARSAKIAGMSVSSEAHYQRMASIQQSMHQR